MALLEKGILQLYQKYRINRSHACNNRASCLSFQRRSSQEFKFSVQMCLLQAAARVSKELHGVCRSGSLFSISMFLKSQRAFLLAFEPLRQISADLNTATGCPCFYLEDCFGIIVLLS